jgi:hypothetical protein
MKYIILEEAKKKINIKISKLLKENIELSNHGKMFDCQLNCNQIIGLNLALNLLNKCDKLK